MPQTAVLDAVDRQVVRCVQLSPRVPFALVAEVLGVSEQTVARRFRRLERDGILRVATLLRPAAAGQQNWMVRVQVRPSGAESLARALAQRDDISWITLVSGGSELVCVLRSRTAASRDDLLMQRLPRTAPVLGMSAAMVMHRFAGVGVSPTEDWSALADALTPHQQRTVAATAVLPPLQDGARFDLTPADHALLAELAHDGRASLARLARVAGISPGRAGRRLTALIEGGVAYLDVDLSAAALGLHTTASLWLTVSPAALDRVGTSLAANPEVAFAAAVTGAANLTASVVCRDVEHLYRFATERVGSIDGVRTMELLPVLRHVKQAGALTEGGRLAVT